MSCAAIAKQGAQQQLRLHSKHMFKERSQYDDWSDQEQITGCSARDMSTTSQQEKVNIKTC